VSELIALDWDHVDFDADTPELSLPGGLQKGAKRDAYLNLKDETARQLRSCYLAVRHEPREDHFRRA
jgi:hypothetical protein